MLGEVEARWTLCTRRSMRCGHSHNVVGGVGKCVELCRLSCVCLFMSISHCTGVCVSITALNHRHRFDCISSTHTHSVLVGIESDDTTIVTMDSHAKYNSITERHHKRLICNQQTNNAR